MTDNGIYYKQPLLKKMRIADIIKYASEITLYPADAIKSKSRIQPLVRIRFAIFTVAREMGYSYPHIARYMNKDDHTTIIHGCEQSKILEMVNPEFNNFLMCLRMKINGHIAEPLNDNFQEKRYVPENYATIKGVKYFWDQEKDEVLVA